MAICGLLLGSNATSITAPVSPPAFATNVAQLRLLEFQKADTACSFRLVGNVWWANPAEGRFVFQDSSGAELLETDLHGESLRSGQQVRLEGHGTITRRGAALRLGAKGPIVDNDGVHGKVEKSGAVYLPAGRQPILVEWFNGVEARQGGRFGVFLPRIQRPQNIVAL
ncbi:MAG TPA: hypothetical protein VJS65_04630 [Verrucomicrobiae bacterium]|nr:hypothetical protein [Verrucomicrobiae bacterium]